MILVTGANGLVGSFLCRELMKREMPFKGLVREKSDLTLLDESVRARMVSGDVSDTLRLNDCLEGVDTVIHCAAVISFDPKQKDHMFQVNVEGTRNLVNVAINKGVRRFIHVSSVAAIASNKGDERTDESTPWPGTEKSSYYGQTKYLAELEVFRGGMEGLSVVCLNPSTILAPGDLKRSSTQLFRYVLRQKKFYTSGLINMVDIRDLIIVVVQLISSPVRDTRFIVSGAHMLYKEFFDTIARNLGKKGPSVLATPLMVGLSVFAEAIKSTLLRTAPLITRETARSGQKRLIYDSSKVVDELNITFRKPEDSIQWVCGELLDN